MPGPPLTPLPFSLATTYPEAFAPLPIVLIGFTFVVVVLAVLALLTFLGGRIFARRGARSAAPAAAEAPASPPDEEVDPVTRAVIAAALYTVLPGERVRIGRITPAGKQGAAGPARD
jgi:Na+-transporting methylmalonyl-CoA/oxaloacetate decarboxylase gamma subunit